MQSKQGLPVNEKGREGRSHGIMLTTGKFPECLNRQSLVTNCHTTTWLAKNGVYINIIMFYILRKSGTNASMHAHQ
ncbi:hypothetical protein [Janthinobacterium sp. RB2P8]|uniref:hypothetical protein n=1 Tax=Janthinobacterium sp. RB2P8 TaxID=3424191 RepID=UPI003F25FA62